MLIAADDALDTAVDLILRWNDQLPTKAQERSEMDNKFKKALDLLSAFAKNFPLKDQTSARSPRTSDPNIGRNVKNSKSPMTILQALTINLRSNVRFPSVSLSLNADG